MDQQAHLLKRSIIKRLDKMPPAHALLERVARIIDEWDRSNALEKRTPDESGGVIAYSSSEFRIGD
jgi:hypothetical protein